MIVREGGCVWWWVRYERVKLISVELVSNAVLVRTVYSADLGIRRILLQIVLPILSTSLPGGEHVCRGGLVIWSCGGKQGFWTRLGNRLEI